MISLCSEESLTVTATAGGFTIKHLNQPNTSFDKEQIVSLPLALHLQGGLEMDINQYNRSFLPRNSFLFSIWEPVIRRKFLCKLCRRVINLIIFLLV